MGAHVSAFKAGMHFGLHFERHIFLTKSQVHCKQYKCLSPARRRRCIDQVWDLLGVSQRRACRVLGQHRSTQRHVPTGRADEEWLVADMIELARLYGR